MAARRGLREWRETSTRSMPAAPRPGLERPRPRDRAVSPAARPISSPSSTAWRWTRPRISARPRWRGSTSIATASPARSAGCRCACSAWTTMTASSSRIISAARLQLTNILRDLDEDAGVGRLYLPLEALRPAGHRRLGPAGGAGEPAARRRPAPSSPTSRADISSPPTPSWRAARAAWCARRASWRRPIGRLLDDMVARGWSRAAPARARQPLASYLDRVAACVRLTAAPSTSSARARWACRGRAPCRLGPAGRRP